VHRDQRNDESFSLSTLIVGSVSSAAAAVVVHELWRTGTIIGAAAMPVLVALFAEALQRPAAQISRRLHSSIPGETPGDRRRLTASRVATRVAPHGSGSAPGVTFRWRLAALTGLAAFVLGAAGLTASEALLQRAVGDRDARTTLFDGGLRRSVPASAETAPAWRPAERVAERARPARKPNRLAHRRAKQPPATPTPTPAPSPTPQPTPTATPEPAPQPIPPTDAEEVDH
jgi:hypothetical protein